MQGPRKEVLTGERNDHQFGSVLAIAVGSAELDQSTDLEPDFVPRSRNQLAPPSAGKEDLEDVTQVFQGVAAVVESLQGPALANACNELEQICAKARSRLSVAATGHDMESNAQPDASPRKGSCLSPLPMNMKVQNTFLVVMDDVLDEPAAHRRASSAPPARTPRHDEEREASKPQEEVMKMDAAALHKQAQTTRLAAAALQPKLAMQHQMTMDPTATDVSFPDQMMWAWVPTAAAPQQSFQQDSMEESAKGMQLEGQRAHLGAAALRAQARLEAVENYAQQEPVASDVEEFTSLMLRNIPLNLTQDMFVKLIDAEGFAGKYDFIYLPTDFETSANLGYAFVNLTAHSHAVRMREKFQGFCRWGSRSVKQCVAQWSSTQGLAAYIYRYRNSHVMHESVPEEAKPRLFNQGVRVAFPAPTRRLKAP